MVPSRRTITCLRGLRAVRFSVKFLNHVRFSTSPSSSSSFTSSRRRDEYGVGGIGKTMAAGVICRCRGKNEGLLGVLKMDDKFRAKGPDLEESYEELSKSLVHNSGGHPWNLEDRVPSSTASQKNNGMSIGEVGDWIIQVNT
ncbi:uncharacterized protein J3R85_002978 [Psidium guajava]|nr:uncharacterized protein J3R85_002978 [Psidium guajava]